MNLNPEQFIKFLSTGKTEKEANRNESDYIDSAELKKLTSKKYGLTHAEARDHLLTDYSNGFTICKCCGTFYQLGNGFTKHISTGCLHCEGEEKHRVYYHNGNNERNYKTSPRWMAQYFDDGMHYCKEKAEIGKFAGLSILSEILAEKA